MSYDVIWIGIEGDPRPDGKPMFYLAIRITLLLHRFKAGGVQQRYSVRGRFQ